MTTRMIMTVVAAATAVAVGAALGGCGTNSTAPSGSPINSQSVAQAHNQADIAFAQGMIPHHAQAIAMAKMAAQRAGSLQVKDLAARIQTAQQPEIDLMSRWLRAWNAPVPSTDSPMGEMEHGASGAMPGMMSGDQMRQLGQASGEAFDRMFLQMMIGHHQGAITMAKTELSEGQNPDARQLAQRIIDAQQREITEMQNLLNK
jgi:uncharacterized protein (DUF305 family)